MDESTEASRNRLRTASNISHLALPKSMNGNDCLTCTSNRESKAGRSPTIAKALLRRYNTTTRVNVSGSSASSLVDTSWTRSDSERITEGARRIRYPRWSELVECARESVYSTDP